MIDAVVGAASRTTTRLSGRAAYAAVVSWVALFAFSESARAASRPTILEVIHKLENPHNVATTGPCGELGAYQFRAATWRMHTSLPFQHAVNRVTSDSIAIKHYEWIKRGLEAAGVPATPYFIALAWNGGLAAAISGRAPAVAHDYAQRAENLAAALERDESAVAADFSASRAPVSGQ